MPPTLKILCGDLTPPSTKFFWQDSLTNYIIFSIWKQAWPEEALASVAKYFLSGRAGLGIEPFIGPLGAMAVGIHRAVEKETARSVCRSVGRSILFCFPVILDQWKATDENFAIISNRVPARLQHRPTGIY